MVARLYFLRHNVRQLPPAFIVFMVFKKYNLSSSSSRYGVSPFEYVPFETEEDMKVAITTVDIKWPSGPDPPYPESLRQFVKWMLQPQPSIRPNIDDIIIHVDKLISKFTS